MERRTKLRPGLCEEGSRRLDETNRFRTFETRNEPVPDVRMNETTGFGRLDNGNQNEPVFTSFYFGIGDI
ncbi:hypothetical protein RIR_jg38080.t1 [Rhizophagus irregularis DAOM 181602=DAOM 197198]|nr:hypothetical protein RIR_jg38080.t1 [Rhizophagus irregularis DAOM 181602=DAOM 197198]